MLKIRKWRLFCIYFYSSGSLPSLVLRWVYLTSVNDRWKWAFLFFHLFFLLRIINASIHYASYYNWRVVASRDSCFTPDLEPHLRMRSSTYTQCTYTRESQSNLTSKYHFIREIDLLSYSIVKIHMYVDSNFTLLRFDIVINSFILFSFIKTHKFQYIFLIRLYIHTDTHKEFDPISNYISCDPRRVRRILRSRICDARSPKGSV